jgi:hypothetical protein
MAVAKNERKSQKEHFYYGLQALAPYFHCHLKGRQKKTMIQTNLKCVYKM